MSGKEPTIVYGESPTGYLSYTDDGRMHTIGVAAGRRAPASPHPTDTERLALYDTMFGYAGTYALETGKVIHHVDISWNEGWTGTDQVRLFEVTGNTLTLTTRAADAATGVDPHYVVVWERVASPR